MRFTRVPESELVFHGGWRIVFRGPEGSGFGDLETMGRQIPVGPDATADAFTARVEFTADDLALLIGGAPLYITQYGGLIPMAVDIPVERVTVPEDVAGLTEGSIDG
jgi:hypothetical protein